MNHELRNFYEGQQLLEDHQLRSKVRQTKALKARKSHRESLDDSATATYPQQSTDVDVPMAFETSRDQRFNPGGPLNIAVHEVHSRHSEVDIPR